MTIAEKMLELLDEGWGVRTLRKYQPTGELAYRCAIGIRLDASEMIYIQDEMNAADILQDDPVTAALARIIREQYPEVVRRFIRESPDSSAMQECLANDVSLVMLFNDRGAKRSDIRVIIEKTIAEGL